MSTVWILPLALGLFGGYLHGLVIGLALVLLQVLTVICINYVYLLFTARRRGEDAFSVDGAYRNLRFIQIGVFLALLALTAGLAQPLSAA